MFNGLFAAGIRITVETPIKKLILCGLHSGCSENATPKLTNLQPGQQYKVDMELNGFDEMIYEFEAEGSRTTTGVHLNIEGITDWRDIKINADGSVYVGPWLFKKERTENPFFLHKRQY